MDELVDRYANTVSMRAGPFDIVMEFSVDTIMGDVAPGGPMPPIERAQVTRVRMSLSHAKIMVPVIIEQIKNLEAQIGNIALPPEQQKRYDTHVKP